MIPTPPFDLAEPGSVVFTAERAFAGQNLTAMCLSLREGLNRVAYLADPEAYLDRYGIPPADRDLVRRRDWTALLDRGAHVHAILKLAATHGGNLYDIGADNVGVGKDELLAACPRRVSGLPGEA